MVLFKGIYVQKTYLVTRIIMLDITKELTAASLFISLATLLDEKKSCNTCFFDRLAFIVYIIDTVK